MKKAQNKKEPKYFNSIEEALKYFFPKPEDEYERERKAQIAQIAKEFGPYFKNALKKN